MVSRGKFIENLLIKKNQSSSIIIVNQIQYLHCNAYSENSLSSTDITTVAILIISVHEIERD